MGELNSATGDLAILVHGNLLASLEKNIPTKSAIDHTCWSPSQHEKFGREVKVVIEDGWLMYQYGTYIECTKTRIVSDRYPRRLTPIKSYLMDELVDQDSLSQDLYQSESVDMPDLVDLDW